ncbi:ankyrin repeat domain-containing protein [Flavobacterium tegetincola]|uniref:ankyrin repeat domain-containing protein n=1 Tax=Flavobacterium tegetincola TaxID=150172 RepID=UPI00040CAD26|nr:ankyrin repeat domain-containing protein [Flavobacterium tegetincola]
MKKKHLTPLLFSLTIGMILFSCNTEVKKNQKVERVTLDEVPPIENQQSVSTLSSDTWKVTDELYEAIFANNTERVIEMLKTKFSPNYEPKNKITPLKAVIMTADNITLAKFMIDGGATINDKKQDLILDVAEYNRLEIMKYLISKGVPYKNNGSFSKAGFYQFYDGAKYLLSKGANQDVGDVRGNLWFYHEAVRKSDYEALNALVLIKDNLDYNDCEGQTALIIAIKNNNLEMVKYLIKRGADKNKTETFDCGDDIYYGKLPIEFAKEKNFREIVEFLK